MKKMTELSVRVLGFREGDQWCALALEMDLRGYGNTFDAAQSELEKAMASQLSFALQMNKPEMALFPAERKYFDMYNEAFRMCVWAEFSGGLSDASSFEGSPAYGLSAVPLQKVAESGGYFDSSRREAIYAKA
jgi:hypothetical protein